MEPQTMPTQVERREPGRGFHAGTPPTLEELWERDPESASRPRALGLTWQDLTVEVLGADAAINENVTSQFNILNSIRGSRRTPSPRTILDRSHGCVKPGEMLLVLGRPGSGCTTLLSILANRRHGYAAVAGDVRYGSMNSAEAEAYIGQIVMNTEEELFFPALTVKQTLDFAARLKVPARLPGAAKTSDDYRRGMRDFLLRSMGIQHTKDTKVGNEYIRGVSGGERKRVSIAECMATRGSIYCWDNSTRGLDASTALEFARAVRTLTDLLGLSSIMSLYQAGNAIYDMFDKVLVLAEGKQIYYGPMRDARPFMEGLGLVCERGSNVADFLTGVTVPTERKIRLGYEGAVPRTASAFRAAYEESATYQQMRSECGYPDTQVVKDQTDVFKAGISIERSQGLSPNSPWTVGFAAQVLACTVRQYQIVWGDKKTLFVRQAINLVMAFVSGSLFYNAPANSSGLFTKGGALFFALLHHSMMGLSEVTDSFTGRPVLVKQKAFALFHPAAFCAAQIAVDIPVGIFQVTVFSVIIYFLVGLTGTAGAFFTHWAIMVAIALCMAAFFRAVGAAFPTFDAASKVSGTLVNAYVIYVGYMIPKPQMHPWLVWVFWLNPLSFAFDALLSTEFHGKVIDCVDANLIPNGPSYHDAAAQSCAGLGGAVQGSSLIAGDDYLASLSYSRRNVWRNFAIIWAWWAVSCAVVVYGTCRWRSSSARGPSQLVPREKAKQAGAFAPDVETQAPESPGSPHRTGSQKLEVSDATDAGGDVGEKLVRNTSVFTWKNLHYTVKTPSGDRVLLDNVQGWVKPGMLGALMGSSGAGKTTLLDVLAKRKTEGRVRGSIMVDGRPLPVSFQRSAGYCEQLDVHEPYATVREALEFSALLRQSRDIPWEEKLGYVDAIIDLLELHDLADTLIGRVGAGLTVEQRKRVTIGVELVAKPEILIFLDEPTSGLDGQSAHNTVRFLRKLAAAGQAVLVTIHQPSAQLFSQFDSLLLLAEGGKTAYFGDIGENAETVNAYFARSGAPCPPTANPAEHMIDVVSGCQSQGRDWNQIWLASPEHEAVAREVDRLVSDAAAPRPRTADDEREFAMPLWTQCRIVTRRMNIALFRNTDYVNNKFMLHITSALFNGFTFWMIGGAVGDLQLSVFTVFNFIFVAPGVMAQLQPLFIERRDLFEAREKKSKTYSWIAFVTGLIVSEIPYLCICAVLYFVCWYYSVGFPRDPRRAGATLFVMIMYEFIYTGIGQFIAAYAPNAVFASLTNPFFLGTLTLFCGVLVPFGQIPPFWRSWLYHVNPFTYLLGSLLVFDLWGVTVNCTESELAVFNPPGNATCAEYLADYMTGAGADSTLANPDATEACRVCPYADGSSYLKGLNLLEYSYGWRNAGIVVLFVFSSYALVYALMNLRTKTSKKAE